MPLNGLQNFADRSSCSSLFVSTIVGPAIGSTRFVIDGIADNSARLAAAKNRGITYDPYVEPIPGADKGLLAALAEHACVVVTDDFPCFFLPRMVTAAATRLPVRFEQVDSNGLLPLRVTDRAFRTAFSFRAFLQKTVPEYLADFPIRDPLSAIELPSLISLPAEIVRRWPPALDKLLAGDPARLAALPIDHSVGVTKQKGGPTAARQQLRMSLTKRVKCYAESANDPDADARSGISPYLHFGHISAQEIFQKLMSAEGWSPAKLGTVAKGKQEGWWGVSPAAEAWLDELITWRELGYNMTLHHDRYDCYESLPDWSRATLEKHASDPREHVYTLDKFAASASHDELWNAAQTQLLREGRIHNYLRMLWGKRILEWTATPQETLDVMIELNNRYALDGPDPNSYSGIFWVLGRYDRPWGPERPVFGTVRYMSSQNTRKKLSVEKYLRIYGRAD